MTKNSAQDGRRTTHRECPECGSEQFKIWWRLDLPGEGNPHAIVCAECGNSVGSATVTDARMEGSQPVKPSVESDTNAHKFLDGDLE